MRWRIVGGQAVLTFRALIKSGRFERAWKALFSATDTPANENISPRAAAMAIACLNSTNHQPQTSLPCETRTLYQCRLALLLGLQMAKKKPNGHLSIEQFDDIAFEDEDFSICLLQAKHSVKAKSMRDSSVDVWKTLHIWIEHLDQGVIPFRSTKFVLITTSSAPVGSAMELLRPGASPGERTTCMLKLRKIAQSGDNESTLAARRRFLSLTDEQARTLLNQIEVLDNHPNLVDVMEDIEGELILTAPRHTTQAAHNLEG